MKEIIELVYIGEEFYTLSKTAMSSIYVIEDGQFTRYDYGFLRRDLVLGHEFHIRQATPEEKGIFSAKLVERMKEK
jgi:hypothetical protein